MKDKLGKQNEEVKKKFKSLGPVKVIILLVMAIGTVCSYVFHDSIFAEDGIFYSGITNSQLLNGLLAIVPKVIQAIRIVTIVLIITTIVIAIINAVFRRTRREITVARLVTNLLKWVVTIVLIIAVLALWGIDTTALITGAGVVTLIVGLGMQSLIADIVAGLFIVFENEFNVGDIITIDDFRGTVLSIGIRTTKLEALGNIKIINNSDIRGVLNQTVNPSTAKSLIDIEYGESLERVEEVIKTNLPDIKIDGIIGDISYDGVATLGASGVTLQFTAKCYEGDIFGVQREMNKRLKLMFDENSVGIPFPQVVVHTAEKSKPAKKTVKKSKKEQK